MSKQYLTIHTLDDVHPTDIFHLAPTPTGILSCSGASSIQFNATTTSDFPHVHTFPKEHIAGVHHMTASANGDTVVSKGFAGEVLIWKIPPGTEATDDWVLEGKLTTAGSGGFIWAVALSADGRYLAGTASDGHVSVWDLKEEGWPLVRSYFTKNSFGTSVAITGEGELVASGHLNGGVYIFDNQKGKLWHSCQGLMLVIRSVAFSPAAKLLAAAGDAGIIAVYDVKTGDQVMTFTGHKAWVMSLDFNATGEYLLSGAYDGRLKIWSIENRACVATHGETAKCLWCVRWLPKAVAKGQTRGEMFAVAGQAKSISFYREASGS
ncbi:WD40 repeat protein [Trichodelitschia bisporula]|uniref:WD40 repeat protein n=1 Tax=Trichodelitschia bisporula TaxID=703511 RepID=A0A6G1HTC0_9PEZI|nr:WD40 repeat protein [Trichodelitschia bisporula]